jgi:hypothetical protein
MRVQRQAEQRFPVRVRIAVPPEGLGRQLEIMHAWLDETCGAEGWATAPAGLAGVAVRRGELPARRDALVHKTP